MVLDGLGLHGQVGHRSKAKILLGLVPTPDLSIVGVVEWLVFEMFRTDWCLVLRICLCGS